jgi:hypothetical protein
MRYLTILLAVGLLAGACSRGTEPELTTTTTAAAVITTTTSAPTTTTTAAEDETTSTTAGRLPSYSVVAGRAGGTIVVLLEPGTYTDIDIRNVIDDVIERFQPSETWVVDSQDAVDAVLKDPPDPADDEIVAAHVFAHLKGTELQYLGPYEDVGTVSIGS